jgi:hypothetical protein
MPTIADLPDILLGLPLPYALFLIFIGACTIASLCIGISVAFIAVRDFIGEFHAWKTDRQHAKQALDGYVQGHAKLPERSRS